MEIKPNFPSDKQVLYNVIEREVRNLLRGTPLFGLFEGTITNYIWKFIDPYVDAFTDNHKLDIEQLSSFASQEVSEKIATFKEKYRKEKQSDEDKGNI